MQKELRIQSNEVGILGVSLYVLGFGLGYEFIFMRCPLEFDVTICSPLVFAPLGEVSHLPIFLDLQLSRSADIWKGA